VSGNDDVECAAAFASKLAPTGVLVAMKMVDRPRISVGASLLAKAQCQAMTMLNVPPPSPASSLQQVFGCLSKIEINQKAASLGRRQIFCASHWYGNRSVSMASHRQDESPDAKGVFE
jgi:hypothetical protein